MKISRFMRVMAAAVALLVAATVFVSTADIAAASTAPQASSVVAATNPYERGPAPTTASIEATTGSFAVSTTVVARGAAYGFGGGTIYYPTATTSGTFGAVAIVPGLTGYQNSIAWLGPRLASQGFVVFTIDTNTTNDLPAQRGDQLNYAMYYLTHYSSVSNRIDPNRLAVMGHSMGGGGALEAAKDYTAYKAVIPMTPYSTDTTWPEIAAPTLVIGSQNDTTTPVNQHAIPIYNGLTNASEKAYLEIRNGTHFTPVSSNTTIASYAISWLKRHVDNDTRYSQFLCPPPAPNTAISAYMDTCPA